MIRGGLPTLLVRDVGAAVRFYVETLGMKLVEQGGPRWAVVDAGDGLRIGLHEQRTTTGAARGSAAPSIGLAPKVPLREAIAILENRGVSFEVTEDGPVTLAFFRDPDGNALYLFQPR